MKSQIIISRSVAERIKSRFFDGKAIIVLGPRQSGKTTLIESIFRQSSEPFLFLNADEPDVRDLLEDATSTRLAAIIGNHRVVCIDEAQRVHNIGITLKLIVDQLLDF